MPSRNHQYCRRSRQANQRRRCRLHSSRLRLGMILKIANQPLVAVRVILVNPGLRSTRGARLRSSGATAFHRSAVPETHAIRKPAQVHAFNGWHQLNELLCRRWSVSLCRTRAESRWLAQRKFRLFTTKTALAERPLVIGFAGGKSNDQRDKVDSSLRSKKRNQPQGKPAALAIKRRHSALDDCSERRIISEATKWRNDVAPGQRWLALQAERNPGLQRQQRWATSDRFTNPKTGGDQWGHSLGRPSAHSFGSRLITLIFTRVGIFGGDLRGDLRGHTIFGGEDLRGHSFSGGGFGDTAHRGCVSAST